MKNIFLILGYGIPRNIFKDENYNFYLKIVFNKIYNETIKGKSDRPLIILCGGKTDMFKPYKRTEAGEMLKFFKKHGARKRFTHNWRFVTDKTSISTLENIVNSHKIIKQRNIRHPNIFVFCEQTREKRVRILMQKIFDKRANFQVLPMDFDASPNRYLAPEFIAKKEQAELKLSLWALKSSANRKKHHQVFVEKIRYLRKFGPAKHTKAVQKWWELKLSKLGNS